MVQNSSVQTIGLSLHVRSKRLTHTVDVRKRPLQYLMFQKPEEKDLLVPCYFFSKYSAGEKFVILDLPLLYESGVSLFLLKDVIVVYW